MKVILDTNVWLDWLVFADPELGPLRAMHGTGALRILIDAPCAAELARVLAYPLGKWTLDASKQAACLMEYKKISVLVEKSLTEEEKRLLPRCADADDQKFLELAAAGGADCLITKDRELLRLARHRYFRAAASNASQRSSFCSNSFSISTPRDWSARSASVPAVRDPSGG